MAVFEPELTLEEVVECAPDEFQDISPLDAGGQGVLFQGNHSGRRAVLKIYGEAHRVRAQRECRTLEQLDSSHVVHLMDWGEVRLRDLDCIYTITSYVEGQTLREILGERTLTDEETKNLAIDLVTAVDELWHLERIVHRDIKPPNIIIRESGSAVILDLGIARHTDQTTITEWGVSWGTNGYKSPEQARARKNLTFKSDYFAIGIVLFEAITGSHPFENRQDLVGKVSPSTLIGQPGVSDELANLIGSMMEIDPLDRPRGPAHVEQILMGG